MEANTREVNSADLRSEDDEERGPRKMAFTPNDEDDDESME
jgi:hypothetical protein